MAAGERPPEPARDQRPATIRGVSGTGTSGRRPSFPSSQLRRVDPASPLRQRAANGTPWTVTQRGTLVPLAWLGVGAVAVTWRDRPPRIPAVSMGEGPLGATQSAWRQTAPHDCRRPRAPAHHPDSEMRLTPQWRTRRAMAPRRSPGRVGSEVTLLPHRHGSAARSHRHRGWWCGERTCRRIAPRAHLGKTSGPALCPRPRPAWAGAAAL